MRRDRGLYPGEMAANLLFKRSTPQCGGRGPGQHIEMGARLREYSLNVYGEHFN